MKPIDFIKQAEEIYQAVCTKPKYEIPALADDRMVLVKDAQFTNKELRDKLSYYSPGS